MTDFSGAANAMRKHLRDYMTPGESPHWLHGVLAGVIEEQNQPARLQRPNGMSLDYQSGDLSQWAGVQAERPEQVRVVSSPQRAGYTHTARFECGGTDHWSPQTAVVRGEVAASVTKTGAPREGQEQWFAWSTYLPEDFQWDGTGDQFFTYTQWHGTPNTGRPILSMMVNPGPEPTLLVIANGGAIDGGDGRPTRIRNIDAGPLQRGVWLDHLVYVKWSSNPARGRVGLWINGGPRFPVTAAANLYEGYSAYMKQGIYCNADTNRTHVLYHTGTVVGDARSDVTL